MTYIIFVNPAISSEAIPDCNDATLREQFSVLYGGHHYFHGLFHSRHSLANYPFALAPG